ncbi:MAG: hypothetical protein LBP82_02965, partial [Candidatus Methanoplasma sp.]|nr:hypothetical protein [Candidatus Methanoplasma sp.]
MNHKKTIIALAAVMMAAVSMSIAVSGGTDAGMDFDKIWGNGFTNSSDGTLYVTLVSTEESPQNITITIKENGKEIFSKVEAVPPQSTHTAELRFRLDGVGDHDLTVECTPAVFFPTTPGGVPLNSETVVINVSESIWSKPSTYGAIIVVVVLILIAAFLKIRSEPATKPDVTFTELDRQQKEAKAEIEEKPKASATEKRKYKGSDGPPPAAAKPPEPPEEKKAASFTELE